MSVLGFSLPTTSMQIAPRTIWLSILVGTVVTVVAEGAALEVAGQHNVLLHRLGDEERLVTAAHQSGFDSGSRRERLL